MIALVSPNHVETLRMTAPRIPVTSTSSLSLHLDTLSSVKFTRLGLSSPRRGDFEHGNLFSFWWPGGMEKGGNLNVSTYPFQNKAIEIDK